MHVPQTPSLSPFPHIQQQQQPMEQQHHVADPPPPQYTESPQQQPPFYHNPSQNAPQPHQQVAQQVPQQTPTLPAQNPIPQHQHDPYQAPQQPPTPSLSQYSQHITSPTANIPGAFPMSPPFSPTAPTATQPFPQSNTSGPTAVKPATPKQTYTAYQPPQYQAQPAAPATKPQRAPSVAQSTSSYQEPSAAQKTPATPIAEPQRVSSAAAQTPSQPPQAALQSPPSPTGKIHPSMLAQWSAATAIKSGPIPNLPSAQPQSPPTATSPKPAQSSPPPQPTYPGHKSTGSVSRSLTFSKKNSDGSPNWEGILLTIDGIPSETFTRLVDGIFDFASGTTDADGLTPDQMRVLFERLGMPDSENHGKLSQPIKLQSQANFPTPAKRYSTIAHQMGNPDPVSFVNTSMIMFYTIFNLTYFTEDNLTPVITREGLTQYMISDVLIDPSTMHTRYNQLLANFGHYIIDPPTKKPFGPVQIDRKCYPAVPNDQYVSRSKKQAEALQARESAESSRYAYNAQSSEGWEYKHQGSWGI
ncbi:hypothetical protein ABW19_dt0210428 [Dactylella cylindrospora]|nr:hypothetical protein ABW19_dt0210428 [Dactylella cylindrospora]